MSLIKPRVGSRLEVWGEGRRSKECKEASATTTPPKK